TLTPAIKTRLGFGGLKSKSTRMSFGLGRFTTMAPAATLSSLITAVCEISCTSASSPLNLAAASSIRASVAASGPSAAGAPQPRAMAAKTAGTGARACRNKPIRSRSGERQIALPLLLRIDNRFHAGHRQTAIARARPQHLCQPFHLLVLGDPIQQLPVHKKDQAPVLRGQHGDAAGVGYARLVAEPVARRQEDKCQYDPDHYVVLPARARKIPQDEALQHVQLLSYQAAGPVCPAPSRQRNN